MAARRTNSRPVRSGRRQPTNWARTTSVAPVALPAASKILLTTIVLSNPGIDETIRRTRGIIHINSDQGAAAENQTGAMGMVVVNDLAVAAGAASLPGPHTDSSDDGWFVWVPFMQETFAVTASGIHGVTYEFDSKAMRRIEEGFSVAVMVENSNATAALEILIGFSLLSSLS